jgi:hypothetical protein
MAKPASEDPERECKGKPIGKFSFLVRIVPGPKSDACRIPDAEPRRDDDEVDACLRFPAAPENDDDAMSDDMEVDDDSVDTMLVGERVRGRGD